MELCDYILYNAYLLPIIQTMLDWQIQVSLMEMAKLIPTTYAGSNLTKT